MSERISLMNEYREWARRSKEIEAEGSALKDKLVLFLGDEPAVVLGSAGGMRYVAEWRTRDNRKLDMRKLTKTAIEKGVQEEYLDTVLREDAVASLVENKVLGPDDLYAALTGTISKYVQVIPTKETVDAA